MMDRRTVLLSGLGLAAAGGFGLAGCKPAGAPATAGSGAAAAAGKSGRTALTLGMVLVEAMPLLVELGVLLDIFVAVFLMGIMVFQINREFDHIDSDQLSALKEGAP